MRCANTANGDGWGWKDDDAIVKSWELLLRLPNMVIYCQAYLY